MNARRPPKLTKRLGNASGVPLSSAQTDTVLLYKGGQPQAILSPAWGAGGTWDRHKIFGGLVELPPVVDARMVFQVAPGAPRARLLVACKMHGDSYVALFIGLCSLHEDSAHTWIHCQKMLKRCQRFAGVPLKFFNWTCRGPSMKPSPKVRFHSLWPCQLRSDQPWSSPQLGWHTRVLARPVMVLTARLSLVDFARFAGSCYTIGNFGGNLSFGCLPFFGLSATYFQF